MRLYGVHNLKTRTLTRNGIIFMFELPVLFPIFLWSLSRHLHRIEANNYSCFHFVSITVNFDCSKCTTNMQFHEHVYRHFGFAVKVANLFLPKQNKTKHNTSTTVITVKHIFNCCKNIIFIECWMYACSFHLWPLRFRPFQLSIVIFVSTQIIQCFALLNLTKWSLNLL